MFETDQGQNYIDIMLTGVTPLNYDEVIRYLRNRNVELEGLETKETLSITGGNCIYFKSSNYSNLDDHFTLDNNSNLIIFCYYKDESGNFISIPQHTDVKESSKKPIKIYKEKNVEEDLTNSPLTEQPFILKLRRYILGEIPITRNSSFSLHSKLILIVFILLLYWPIVEILLKIYGVFRMD